MFGVEINIQIYLGSEMNAKGGCEQDAKNRIKATVERSSRCFVQCQNAKISKRKGIQDND